MFTLVGALFAGLLSTAAACTCAVPSDEPKCGRDNAYVLRGSALQNKEITCPPQTLGSSFFLDSTGVTFARFEVTAVLRQPEGGTLEDGDAVNLRAEIASSLCGFQVEPDVEYVLFAYERDPEDCEANPPGLPIAITDGTRSLKNSDLVFLDTGLNLGTSSCSGNIKEPSDEELSQLEADCDARDEGPDIDLDGPPAEEPLPIEPEIPIGDDGDPMCGQNGEVACPDGQQCIDGVEIEGMCEACGARGEPLCPDSGCSPPYVPWHKVAGIRRCGLGSTREFVEE